MRIPLVLTLIGAVVGVIIILLVGQALLTPNLPLIIEAGFSHEAITPNADGTDDVAIFSYQISKTADISLDFEGTHGESFAFRQNEPRTPQRYQVAFSGVVDGFVLPGDNLGDQQVIRRLIPDDTYTWRLTAVDRATGEQDQRTGQLIVQNGDAPLPLIPEFTVFPTDFTPNQDGINDRTRINVGLEKDAELSVYLLAQTTQTSQTSRMEQVGQTAQPIYLTEMLQDVLPDERGRHLFDYDGGVDQNAEPPPDGTYTVVADAKDAVGQEVRRTAELTIEQGGKPFAEIVPQPNGVTVAFEDHPWEERFLTTRFTPGDLIDPPSMPDSQSRTTITMPQGDLLVFVLTVENYSDVPIRTTGPDPGTVYEWDQRAATFGATDESGAWRVGIDCMTAASDYPWRWALGNDNTLTVVNDPDTGVKYRYLPPHQRAVVWGAVRMTDIEVRNPQTCWAGLIHEDVEISQVNQNVGVREIRLVQTNN